MTEPINPLGPEQPEQPRFPAMEGQIIPAPETVVLPALPEGAPDNLRLQRDLAVAGLALKQRITLAEASGALEAIMERVRGSVEDAITHLVEQEQRSPAKQAEATRARDEQAGTHGQTVAGPNSTRIER